MSTIHAKPQRPCVIWDVRSVADDADIFPGYDVTLMVICCCRFELPSWSQPLDCPRKNHPEGGYAYSQHTNTNLYGFTYQKTGIFTQKLVWHACMQDCSLPSRLNWILPSSGILRSVRCFETDVSGVPIGSIFRVKIAWHLDSWRWGW
jgi:hypothetical protein